MLQKLLKLKQAFRKEFFYTTHIKDFRHETDLFNNGSFGNSLNLPFPYHIHNFIIPDYAPLRIKSPKSHPQLD